MFSRFTRFFEVNNFMHSFIPIIICRFTLDLRQINVPGSSDDSSEQSFSCRLLGNAGEMLQFAKDGDEPEGGEDDADESHIQSTSDITSRGPAAEQTHVDSEMAGENLSFTW